MKKTKQRGISFTLVALAACLAVCAAPIGAQTPGWNNTGSLSTARTQHTATLLANGKVLVTGGLISCAPTCQATNTAELYNPATGAWSSAGTLPDPLANHAAVRLQNGKALVIGGYSRPGVLLQTAYLYDPDNNTWSPAGTLGNARQFHKAVLLPNGKVLVTGGLVVAGGRFVPTNTAELYDPTTGMWTSTGAMNVPRLAHTMTLLANGKVLVATGSNTNLNMPPFLTPVRSCELYDPATGAWSLTGEVALPRTTPTATLLANGKVLLAGGTNNSTTEDPTNTAELYDPATGQWGATGNLSVARDGAAAALLASGKVLLAGGYGNQFAPLKGADLYDPATGSWAPSGEIGKIRVGHTVTLLGNGKVLVAAGNDDSENLTPLTSAELYDSGAATVTTVSAASYSFQTAAREIAAAFGQNLATATAAASTIPLPTSLAGTSVRIRDSNNVERLAPLFFISPGQINYQVPDGAAPGQAIVTVTKSDGTTINGALQILAAAPAIFTLNQSGSGPAAAADAFSGAPAPFNATRANGEPNVISVFGTGLGADATDVEGNVNASVQASIGGQAVTVLYAGRAPGFVGLNQLNILLPAGIASGTHTVIISRNGVVSNTVTIASDNNSTSTRRGD
jgi:uncharacterized protein (TIGR03437 family)